MDQVKAAGVTYFSAAGNDARNSYESEFRPSADTIKIADANGEPFGDYILHDFDPEAGVDYFQRITIPAQGALVSFQWSEPFASICPISPGSESDLDIFIFTQEGNFSSAIFGGFSNNFGGDALEFLSPFTDFSVEAYIVIGKFVGVPEFDIEVPSLNPNPERIKYIYFGGDFNEEYATNSGAIFGHPNAAGAIAVGAVPYFGAPAFTGEAPVLEPFSSAGGVPILLSPCGEPIAPEVRQKPEITGPDGGNTTFFFSDIAEDEDDFPNFFGTSASAPHVAGLAALMKQAADISPDSIKSILISTALDMDDPATPGPDLGFDFGTGYGFVRAPEALSQLTNCAGLARLELYNADTDSLIQTLGDGDIFSSADLGTNNLAIRAITFPQKVGSVEIRISGSLESRQVENLVPYASFGDNNPPPGQPIDYAGRPFQVGTFRTETYTVEATAFTLPKAQGDTLGTLRLTFSLRDELLSTFILINSLTDEPIDVLTNFTIIDLSQTGNDLNVRVTGPKDDELIGSVGLSLVETDISGAPLETVLSRTENVPPFALFGNEGDNYRNGSFAEGFYELTATPFRENRLQGNVGPSVTLIFAVSDDGRLPDEVSAVAATPVVYPNPLTQSNNLRVKWSDPESNTSAVTLRLLNQQGQELIRRQASVTDDKSGFQLDVQGLNLAPGVYFLRIERADAAPQTVRILKE